MLATIKGAAKNVQDKENDLKNNYNQKMEIIMKYQKGLLNDEELES